MKILSLLSVFVLIYLTSYSQDIQSTDNTEKVDSATVQKFESLKKYYLENNFTEVIRKAAFILRDTAFEPPADFYRYLACSYYHIEDLRSAYENMVVYIEHQDPSLLDNYDIYLSAQFAARQKSKDKTALGILGAAYDKDTCLANKKLYAAAIVNHYLQTGSKYAATAWREKLLPLKELSKEEMYRISRAWYTFNEGGRVIEIFGQFASVYPNAFRSLFMHGGIKTEPEDFLIPEN